MPFQLRKLKWKLADFYLRSSLTKRGYMNFRKMMHAILVGICTLITTLTSTVQAMDPSQLNPAQIEELQKQQYDAIQAMSPEERVQFQQAMLEMMTPEQRDFVEKLNKALEADMSTKSPEEQAAFMQKSPMEQEAYIKELLDREHITPPGVPEQQPVSQPTLQTPSAMPAPVQEPEKPIIKKIEPKKRDQALEAIQGILEVIPDFLSRVDRMPEFMGKFGKWVNQGKLHNIKPTDTWQSIRKQIDNLEYTLNKLIEKTPQTQEYKYLNDFIEDEALFNNLIQLNTTLQAQDQRFEEIDKQEQENEEMEAEKAFGLMATSKEIRSVMRAVINAFLEAFEKTKIPENITKVFEKYEPTAKKLREGEEEAKKKAFEESKKERRWQPPVIGGARDEESRYFGGPGGYPGYDQFGGQPLPGGYSDFDKDKRAQEEDKNKKPEPKAQEAPKKEEKEKKKDKAITGQIDHFASSLRGAVDDIVGSQLDEIKNHMRASSEPDTETAKRI